MYRAPMGQRLSRAHCVLAHTSCQAEWNSRPPNVNVNDTSLLTLSEVYLAEDQRSYMLDFQESTAQMGFEEDQCQVYGFPFAAFNLCLQNMNQSSLQASK